MCSGWYLNVETNVYHPSAGKANALCAFCQDGGLLGAEEAFRGMFLQRWCLPAELRYHNRRSIGIHTHEAGTLTRDQPEAGPESIPSLSEQLHGRLKVMGSVADHLPQTGINIFIYIIYLFKVIAIQHKHTFSPQITYFNRNNSDQDHACSRRFPFTSVPTVAAAEFVI